MLKRFSVVKAAPALFYSLAVLAVLTGAAHAELTGTRMFEESVRVPGSGAPVVIVKNVFGSIRVTTHDRDTVDMTATETVHGDLQADIARAHSEVELRTESEEGRVAFRVRRIGDNSDFENRWDGNHWDGYRVEYAIEVRVPRAAGVELSTVNNGEIVVNGVHGDFVVSNVNGPVRLTALRGAGRISTVNGPIEASFDRAPAAATGFKTINGKIEATFPQDLAADLDFKTMHGQIYTDFEVQPLARPPDTERKRDGDTLVIRTQRSSGMRVGAGGPALSFETLNGNVYVRRAAR